MRPVSIKKGNFLDKYRYWIIAASIMLFLPPLSLLFQTTGDSNFCGTWCPRMFYVWRAGESGAQFLAGFFRSYMGAALVISVLGGTFLFGRYWCSHFCPVGGTMELVSRALPNKLKIDFSPIPAPSFRYGYLAVFFIAPALGLGSLCCNYCNFATLPRLFGAAFLEADLAYFLRTAGWINLGLVIVLGFLSRGGRAYCNLLCPVGALDALVNKAAVRLGGKKHRVRIKAEKCNGCRACLSACPTWAITIKADKAAVDQFSCIPCRSCKKVCSREAVGHE